MSDGRQYAEIALQLRHLMYAGIRDRVPHLNAAPVVFQDTGPLRVRDQFLLNMGVLVFTPDTAEPLLPGVNRIELKTTVTNTFAKSEEVEEILERRDGRAPVDLGFLRSIPGPIFYLDGEIYRTALTLDRQVAPRVQLGMTLQWLNGQGGVLDGMIEEFHDTFGLSQNGRRGVPRDDYRVYLRDDGNELYLDSDPDAGWGDVLLTAKVNLRTVPRPVSLSVETSVKLPVGDEDSLYSSGSVDVGAQLLATLLYPCSCLHGSLGVLYLGEWEKLGLPSQVLFSGMVAYEHRTAPSSAVVFQLTASESPFAELSLPELGQTSLQASVGYKHQFAGKTVLFLAFTENIAHFNNTADIGFHLGLSRAF